MHKMRTIPTYGSFFLVLVIGCFSGKKLENIFQWKKSIFSIFFPDGKKKFHGKSMEMEKRWKKDGKRMENEQFRKLA